MFHVKHLLPTFVNYLPLRFHTLPNSHFVSSAQKKIVKALAFRYKMLYNVKRISVFPKEREDCSPYES